MTDPAPYDVRARLSVAPMMDRTDRHYRRVARQLTRHTLLYTEMVTAKALIHGDPGRHLQFDCSEHPLVLQLGGDDPAELGFGARLAREWGYDEVNLNVGCPSDRVQRGRFGACLMAEPERVRDALWAMADSGLPVSVKHRIGIDHADRYEDMLRFVDVVAEAKPVRFTVHARKAWLQGLSPKQNRTVPPLRHAEVHRLKRHRPHLRIETNGGLRDFEDMEVHWEHVDAVMVGRAAYEDCYTLLSQADRRAFLQPGPAPDRIEALRGLFDYVDREVHRGTKLSRITRHLLGWFNGIRGAKSFRRILTTEAILPGAGVEVLERALRAVEGQADVSDQVCTAFSRAPQRPTPPGSANASHMVSSA